MGSLTAGLRTIRLVQAIDPWLALVILMGAWVRFSRVAEFDNLYYTATVASMLQSPHNFVFGSFDPEGIVMVDKPPGAFWVQAFFAYLFGISSWSVNVPQAIAGTLAPLVLYSVLKRGFGRVAALAAAAVLVVIPASIVIDSRNEPDGLLSFALLLGTVCIIRAGQTRTWRWLLAFSLFVGFAFNVKMLVAFVPLPVFLLYYLLRAQVPGHKLAMRIAAATAVLLVVSFSWATFVSLTPAANRPYVGSTRDNSIWTLTFKYNGLDRFTSFIGPRPSQPQSGAPGGPVLSPGAQQPQGTGIYGPQPEGLQPPVQPGLALPQQAPAQPQGPPPYQANDAPPGPLAINPNAASPGVLGLLADPLAAQLGWLLPLAVLLLVVALVPLLPERLYRHPLQLQSAFRDSPCGAQAILWVGWLLTAAVVFGVANATTTHPYYLVGMAVPMAAVVGIGFATLWQAFQRGPLLAWVVPAALLGGAAYQAFLSKGLAADLIVGVVLVIVLLACTVMTTALLRRLAETPLAKGSVAVGAIALLVVPLAFGLHFGERIAGAAIGPPSPAQQLPGGPDRQRELKISTFIRQQGYAPAKVAVGTVSAREAAPFIIAGVPAIAIGGFSGGDPILSVASFREMAQRGDFRYFLMPGEQSAGGPPGRAQQQPILNFIRTTWLDVSESTGLPRGSLFRYEHP